MKGPSRAAALPRTPATNPAETGTPVRAVTSLAARATAGSARRPPAPPSREPAARTAPGRSPPPGPAPPRLPRTPGSTSRRPGTRSPSAEEAATPRTPAFSAPCPAPARRTGHARSSRTRTARRTPLIRIRRLLQRRGLRPGCLPGLRPDLCRSDRSCGFFLYGLSDDGGLDDVEESLSSRRRSSSTCAASAAICASRAASCAAASSSRAAAASRNRALRSSSSATRARSHATSSDAGTCGVSGTTRTPPQPADSHQHDTPSRLASLHPAPPAPATPSITQAE